MHADVPWPQVSHKKPRSDFLSSFKYDLSWVIAAMRNETGEIPNHIASYCIIMFLRRHACFRYQERKHPNDGHVAFLFRCIQTAFCSISTIPASLSHLSHCANLTTTHSSLRFLNRGMKRHLPSISYFLFGIWNRTGKSHLRFEIFRGAGSVSHHGICLSLPKPLPNPTPPLKWSVSFLHININTSIDIVALSKDFKEAGRRIRARARTAF